MIALLTTSLLTSYGEFSYSKISNEEVKELLKKNTVISYIRHVGIIEVLKEDFNINIAISDGMYKQASNETALVFKLNNNFRVSGELDAQTIRKIGYNFGLLIKK